VNKCLLNSMELPQITPETPANESIPSSSIDVREAETHVDAHKDTPNRKNQFLFLGIAGVILLGALVAATLFIIQRNANNEKVNKRQIRSYEECLNSVGSTLTTSKPLRCTTRDGFQFNEPTQLQMQALTSSESATVETDPQIINAPGFTANWKEYIDPLDSFKLSYPEKNIQVVENSIQSNQDPQFAPIQTSFNSMFHYDPPKILRAIVLKDLNNLQKINDINKQDPVNGYLQYTDANRFQYVVEVAEIWIMDNTENLSARDWYDRYSNYPAVFQSGTTEQREIYRPSTEINIQGVLGYYTTKTGGTDVNTKVVLIPRGSKMFLIFIQGNPVQGSIGDQIFSTLSFTQ
jgi:hypothetical protein